MHHGERRRLTNLLLQRGANMLRKERDVEAATELGKSSKDAAGSWSFLPTMASLTHLAMAEAKEKKRREAEEAADRPPAGFKKGLGSDGKPDLLDPTGGIDERIKID